MPEQQAELFERTGSRHPGARQEWAPKVDAESRRHNPNPMVRAQGFGPEGKRCKTCKHLRCRRYSKRYYKCAFRHDTRGPATDHRVNWPACSKYEEADVPVAASAQKDGEDARGAAYQRLQEELDDLQREYLDVMKLAAKGQLPDEKDRRYRDLTDAEASAWLTHLRKKRAKEAGRDPEKVKPLRRSTVNGRRNELMGRGEKGKPFKDHPLIVPCRKRQCRVTGSKGVNAWRVVPGLFD